MLFTCCGVRCLLIISTGGPFLLSLSHRGDTFTSGKGGGKGDKMGGRVEGMGFAGLGGWTLVSTY